LNTSAEILPTSEEVRRAYESFFKQAALDAHNRQTLSIVPEPMTGDQCCSGFILTKRQLPNNNSIIVAV